MLNAQDYGWWNDLVQWDGVSHWSEYLSYTPRFFGPNALPIPRSKNGTLPKDNELELGIRTHLSPGDKTINLTGRTYIQLAPNKVGIELSIVPLEHFSFDEQTRDLRRAREFDGEGLAVGDLYLATWIQLFQNKNNWDGLLTLQIKTASGSNRAAARFTDTGGYAFDLSFGKTNILNGNSVKSIRTYFQAGLYVWQTNEDKNPQNDALSYGAGIDLHFDKFKISSQLAGYAGYKGNGDKPMVIRVIGERNINLTSALQLGFSYGLVDNIYNSISMSYIYTW